MAAAYETNTDYSESDSDYSDEEFDFSDQEYEYEEDFSSDHDGKTVTPKDPEHFEHALLLPEAAKEMVTKKAQELCEENFSVAMAKMLVASKNWDMEKIVPPLKVEKPAKKQKKRKKQKKANREDSLCSVCFLSAEDTEAPMMGLYCGHRFCRDCWEMYLKTEINSGNSTRIACMTKDCNVLTDEDFVLAIVKDSKLAEKYQNNSLKDVVTCHSGMRFCPSRNCEMVVFTPEPKPNTPQKVHCTGCNSTYCFTCTLDHHAPTDCKSMKNWLTKCKDDSATANYIRANTKNCPKCDSTIEKNSGCNHMTCKNCKHEFCWVCLKSWPGGSRGLHSYNCNKFKNVIGKENAKLALKKYLFHFERYDNHSRSLKLEETTVAKIKAHIQGKVDRKEGTWIDWQYLLTATDLLLKCRYTLMHSYPHIYYLKQGPQKELVELAQSELEREVEELSFIVDNSQITDRADIELRMNVAEQRRINLLEECLRD